MGETYLYKFCIDQTSPFLPSPFSCEKGCHGDDDCGTDERCNERVWRCVKTRCKEPYKQARKKKLLHHTSMFLLFQDRGRLSGNFSGLDLGQHALFVCDRLHMMPPTARAPFPRRQVSVFCMLLADQVLGTRVGWALENGAEVPLCQEGGGGDRIVAKESTK